MYIFRIFRIEQLLTAGIDINSCDGGSSNNSVLHWAVSFSDLPTVKLLLGNSSFLLIHLYYKAIEEQPSDTKSSFL